MGDGCSDPAPWPTGSYFRRRTGRLRSCWRAVPSITSNCSKNASSCSRGDRGEHVAPCTNPCRRMSRALTSGSSHPPIFPPFLSSLILPVPVQTERGIGKTWSASPCPNPEPARTGGCSGRGGEPQNEQQGGKEACRGAMGKRRWEGS